MSQREHPGISQEAVAYLAAQPDIELAFLFGSRALGRAGPGSDYDVAVRGPGREKLGWRRVFELSSGLARLLQDEAGGEVEVDVVDLAAAPIELQYSAIQPGVCLVARDETRRIDYEAGVLDRYFDYLPYLRWWREVQATDEYRTARRRRIERAYRAARGSPGTAQGGSAGGS